MGDVESGGKESEGLGVGSFSKSPFLDCKGSMGVKTELISLICNLDRSFSFILVRSSLLLCAQKVSYDLSIMKALSSSTNGDRYMVGLSRPMLHAASCILAT